MKRLALLSVLWFGVGVLQGAELAGGRLYTKPQTLYVNQSFEILLELEVTAGSEISDLRIANFINDPEFITVEQLESLAPTQRVRNQQTLRVYRFAAQARAHRPFSYVFNSTITCQLVDRRVIGFFSRSYLTPAQLSLPPFTLHIKALPQEGCPPHFTGKAVGEFEFVGKLSDTTVESGDLLTLELEIVGNGWVAPDFEMPAYASTALLKAYPVKELLREEGHLKVVQSLVPQSTNLTELAHLQFVFFDPVQERYIEHQVGPFSLNYRAAGTQVTNEVKLITPELRESSDVLAGVTISESLIQAQHYLWPLGILAGGILLAFFTLFLLFARHKVWALAVSIAIFSSSAFTAYWFKQRTEVATYRVLKRTPVRFAPATSASTLFHLSADSEVILLEDASEWLRIDAAGKRGWLPATACEKL